MTETTGDPAAACAESYDRVASDYAARFSGELEHKPLDRALLTCFVESLPGPGRIADVGCGPGQVARFLADRGQDAIGIDLSPGMVALARELHPAVPFQVGTMLGLDLPDGSLVGITCFYAIIHLPPADIPRCLREFRRVLVDGGIVLLSFHIGDERVHRDEFLDQAVDLDFYFLQPQWMQDRLREAGFDVEARIDRAPYTPLEYPSRRGYILARRSREEPA